MARRNTDARSDRHGASPRQRRRRLISPLTRRILTINILALALLLAGLLYLGKYEENLIEAEFQALATEGEIFAGALGQGAYGTQPDGKTILRPEVAAPMLRRLVLPTRTRARLFSADGGLIADSRILLGPEGAPVQIINLPPPDDKSGVGGVIVTLYENLLARLPGRRHLARYQERRDQKAADYDEVVKAQAGSIGRILRANDSGGLVISVAVPVQRFKQILGVVLLTTSGTTVDETVRSVRFDILKIFGVALAVTILLSLYLAGSIVRPLHRLAEAADRVRRAPGRERSIPDFGHRQDEIGTLARDLNAMTDALSARLDAIESFAADVAHEIKNPLTSLRSAVETAARVTDPEQQKKLMGIILDDVQRLDRLISDISDASRLDTELSRLEHETVDLDRLLSALVEVHRTSGGSPKSGLTFKVGSPGPFKVVGMESRLVQVFQNLITNAFSFSPDGGQIGVEIRRDGAWIVATVEDEGPGIPAGGLAKIFDRFYSERPEGERFGTHSGLGLSISRQIVEAHSGHIRAENRTGTSGAVTGARFVVTIPTA
ncbi:MAG: HAMP domain-containing protein [Rhodospirillaceae bacterium]|nr:HAMP domain-containing protein [Rhodospirillaceae bacterium]